MFYRYELYVDNEYQGVGIFRGLGELELDEDVEDILLQPFDKELRFIFGINKPCAFMFTERGNTKFEDDIQRIIDVFKEDALFEARCLTINEDDIPPDDTIYEDAYQIAVVPEVLERFRRGNQKDVGE